MKSMFETLRFRWEAAVQDRKEPRAHVYLYETDQHGDQLNLHSRSITDIGTDFIEVQGEGLVDRNNVRSVAPVNF